jgi:tripartite-type tricarboxylate transporter receptor subunit TctC
VDGYEFTQWHGLVAPAKTPADIIGKLNLEIVRLLKSPKVREKLASLGSEPVGRTPTEFAALIRSELTRYADIVKLTGMKPE